MPSPFSLRSVVVLGCCLAAAGPVCAGERYYLIIFGAETERAEAKFAHSFATFVKATGEGDDPRGWCIEPHTISWLPASLDVHLWRFRPEPGVNLDLEATIDFCHSNAEGIARWGPYEIEKELYDRALEQIAHLESGAVKYKAIDSGFRTDTASNCIHAISDLARKPRLRISTPGWGHFASFVITLRLRPWIIDTATTHSWVGERLGLCKYPMTVRDLDTNPRGLLGIRFCPLRGGW